MAIFETALVRGLRHILGQVRELGVNSDDLLREAGLHSTQVDDPDSRIAITELADFWRVLIRRLPDRALGVRLGASFDVRQSGLVGYLALNSADLGTALQQVVRFSRILNEAVRPRLLVKGGRGVLSWVPSALFRPYPQVADWGLGALLTCLRQVTGVAFEPVEVWALVRQLPVALRRPFRR